MAYKHENFWQCKKSRHHKKDKEILEKALKNKKVLKNKTKILIVGGTGFIGYHLAKKLIKKNFNIFSISTKFPKKNRRVIGVKYFICDISKIKILKKKIGKNKFDFCNKSWRICRSHKQKKNFL